MRRAGSVILIALFEVPPDADERFIAEWPRMRELLAQADAPVLHRALRADVRFRFVGVARVDASPSGSEALRDGGLPFAAHASHYEILHEDGDPDGAGGAILINAFAVPPPADERFLDGWERARSVLATQRGYLGTRLHRSIAPADLRFVNIARWSSPLMFSRALATPEFQQGAGAMPFPSHPALYQVVPD